MEPDRHQAETPRRPSDTWLTDGWHAYADDGCAGELPARPDPPRAAEPEGRRPVHSLVAPAAAAGAVAVTGTAPLVVADPWLWIAPALLWPAAVVWAIVSSDGPRRT